jgi:hypothetical protein
MEAINNQQSTINNQQSAISNQQSEGRGQRAEGSRVTVIPALPKKAGLPSHNATRLAKG